MNFPVAIHKDKNSDYGVIFPDVPGCFSAGSSIEDALENSKEAILCHFEGLIADNEPLPSPKNIETYKSKRQFKNVIWGLILVDLSELSGKAKRVNITIPDRILSQFDNFAQKKGESRSGFLVNAAIEYMAHHNNE